jgi:hypothetical protein
MRKVLVLAEGQTEFYFLRGILAPYLQSQHVVLAPTILESGSLRPDLKFRGGATSYAKIRKHRRELLRDSSAAAVTTMLDFYGLPSDFPGVSTLSSRLNCYQKAEHLEMAFAADIGDRRVLPYLSLHEFESILFADPSAIQEAFPDTLVEGPLRAVCNSVGSPEEIDDGPSTHPSARLAALLPQFRKRKDGPPLAEKIGLPAIRACCPHFNSWISRLEALGNP